MWSGGRAAAQGALQQQVQLLADPVLGDRTRPVASGPHAGLGVRVLRPPRSALTSSPGDRSPDRAQHPDRLLEQHRHRRDGATVELLGDRGDRLVGLAGGPAEPDRAPGGPARPRPRRRRPRPGPRRAGAARRSCRAAPGPSARRPSCRCPAPGSASTVSPPAIARRTTSGGCTASTACASRGPTPLAVCSSSNSCFASSSANPYRVSESSRTIRRWPAAPRCPTRSPARVLRRAVHGQADPADLDHGPVRRHRGDPPPHARDHRALLSAALPRTPVRGCRRARHDRSPAPARRRRRRARGATDSRSSRVTIAVTCALSA